MRRRLGFEKREVTLPASAQQKMPPALQQQVSVFIKGNGGIGTVELFLDDQMLACQLFDGLVVRNITDLKARTFNVPRARVFVDFITVSQCIEVTQKAPGQFGRVKG